MATKTGRAEPSPDEIARLVEELDREDQREAEREVYRQTSQGERVAGRPWLIAIHDIDDWQGKQRG